MFPPPHSIAAARVFWKPESLCFASAIDNPIWSNWIGINLEH
jgi:hypothetical protein